jgi:anaerobic selenocysteine-containing dehydrogenase
MSNRKESAFSQISRRDFLNVAAIGGGALIAIGLAGQASAEPKKFTQQKAKYQPVPKNGQRCQNCALWQSPNNCQVVEGPVSPAGWCLLYQAKS